MKTLLAALCCCCLIAGNLPAQEADSITATRVLPAELAWQDAALLSAANQDQGVAPTDSSGLSVMEVEGFTSPQAGISQGWESMPTGAPCCQPVPARRSFRNFQRPMPRRSWRPRMGSRGCC